MWIESEFDILYGLQVSIWKNKPFLEQYIWKCNDSSNKIDQPDKSGTLDVKLNTPFVIQKSVSLTIRAKQLKFEA